MVTSCFATGQDFSLLTPTLLIDGLVENMSLRLREFPVAGLSRTLTVVARKGELLGLPMALAKLSKQKLAQQLADYMGIIGKRAWFTTEQERSRRKKSGGRISPEFCQYSFILPNFRSEGGCASRKARSFGRRRSW